ncbi:swr complex subunit [Monascus purpureus]|uniref:SWR1-complex protein 5 n=1 Tax=Monascus purpureus TaxID=5098 RepID=A0A507QUC2_MONPU|nr:swr complex subunit [Monascus purpureus]BDD57516.1 swr complex subunit [Monascus purpureus]
MPPLVEDNGPLDEPYDSAEDEDFQLDEAEADDAQDSDLSSSDAEEEQQVTEEPAKKKRRTGPKTSEENALDSGDEATIRKAEVGKKKRKGKGTKSAGGVVDNDDEEEEDDMDFDEDKDEAEGGAGGFVKTRAMRMRMTEERKPLAKIEGATVDVDALWEMMNAPSTGLGLHPPQNTKVEEKEKVQEAVEKNGEVASQTAEVHSTQTKESEKQTSYPEEMIKIKRTYKFAGDVITEEKVVPKDSAEAKLFLAGGKDVEIVTAADVEGAANAKSALKLRRPLRKISRFDPNPTGSIKKSWEKQTAAAQAGAENAKGPKINTVEKSRLDWAAYVDQAGIKDELRVHSKAKEGYLNRMDFLDRVEAKREEERRNLRLKGS